ncbi:sigma-70 family RNA polymerase sigma factor [uncultured Treponema sp.]|uniref:sigma-70 family RNA polymerase sigma factor n=1 Tax=uncultured Treponema sp. TaxID=162155 RepID=UPI0025925FDE|nr:sigma-70 family RNA polymerase sigma factor [uncultured Treponema sp.]
MTVGEIQNQLFSQYKRNGFLSENEITDYCVGNNLDFFETDEVMQFLIDKKVLFSEEKGEIIYEEEDIYDKAQIDYDDLFDKVLAEYPNFKIIVEHIKNIKPPQHREWKNLIQEAQGGNVYAFNRMTEMYLRGVLRISYNFAKENYCDFEDAFQNGTIGLIRAIKSFDVTSPNSFAGYYSLSVLSEMRRKYSVKNSFFDLPAHFSQKTFEFLGIISKYLAKGKTPEESIGIISDDFYLEINPKLKMYFLPYLDLDAISYENFAFDIHIEDDIIYESLKEQLNEVLHTLPERERKVLEMRFGLNNLKQMTLEEVGKYYNVSRERIRQIEAKAIKRLQATSIKSLLNDYMNS